MGKTERHGPFIADFHAHGTGLRETDVMCVAGFSITNQARLRGNEFEMWFVANAPWRADGNNGVADGCVVREIIGFRIGKFLGRYYRCFLVVGYRLQAGGIDACQHIREMLPALGLQGGERLA
jgi:hypothetical protein